MKTTHTFNTNVAKIYGVAVAIILNFILLEITYNKRRNKHYYDGFHWVRKSAPQIANLLPYLSVHQIRRSLKKLTHTDLLIVDDFNDNNISDWTVVSGSWSASSGELNGTNNTSVGIALAPTGDVTDGTITVDVKSQADGAKKNALIIFAYQDNQNYRLIDMRDNTDKWFIREFVNGTRFNRNSWPSDILLQSSN